MISCRVAAEADLPALLTSTDLFDDVPFEEGLCALIGSEWDWLIVAEVDGVTAGFCSVHALPRPDAPRHGFMYEIGTAEEFQRQGVASALIEFARAECDRRGVAGLWVITNRSNEPACRLYASAGAISRAEDDVVYEWS